MNNLKRPFVLVPVLHCSTLGMSLQYVRRATSLKLHLRVARSRGFVQLDPLTILKIHQERAMFRSRVSPLDVSGRLPGAPATRRWANMASAPHIKKLKVLVRTMVYPINDFNIEFCKDTEVNRTNKHKLRKLNALLQRKYAKYHRCHFQTIKFQLT